MDRRARTRILWGAIVSFLVVALAASAWAALAKEGCGGCDGARALARGGLLAWAGVAFYATLLASALLLGPSRSVYGGVLLAAGTHAVLLLFLARESLLCPPCLLAGGAAIAGAVASCLLEPANISRGSVFLPIAAAGTHLVLFALGTVALPERESLSDLHAPARVRKENARQEVRMVIYERADCEYCRRLKEEVLPGLLRDFRERLQVESRSAEAMPWLPTPTILLSGPGGERSFPGLPATPRLRAAILESLGALHDRPAMLPAPR